ncbi:BA75_00508T0 [Komagataella pastoris]|uniref:BA75_00508T0 n=1 Tax=Komagataella pastoris TaxID=4922 RepID=A0A1B2J9X7_PICPA|nr:BA75_00508T0 [Komagataella pastoris]
MFKKDPDLKPLSNLKNSDRKKLFAKVAEDYKVSNVPIDYLFPSDSKQGNFKSPLKISGTIYTDAECTPSWFKTKDSNVLPSIITLWRYPALIPIVLTNDMVIGKLINGADLMLPGCIPPFDSRCLKGSIVGVASYKQPNVVYAVGECLLDLSQVEETVGKSGVAVRVYHHFEDHLCQLAKITLKPPKEEEVVENFLQFQDVTTEETSVEEDGLHKNAEAPNSDVQDESAENNEVSNSSELAEVLTELSVEDVDVFFERALLQTITQDKVSLPISASNFMNHILKNMPSMDSNLVTIKKTSWKKTSKYLKAMQKLKLLDLKGKGEDLTIISLASSGNEKVRKFVPYTVKSVNSFKQSQSKPSKDKLTILFYYKPNSCTRSFFNDNDKMTNVLYSQQELKDILNEYIRSKDLVREKNKVFLNPPLQEIVRLKDGRTIARDKIFSEFLKGFTISHKIIPINTPSEEVESIKTKKGNVPKVEIVTEMRIGRKVVTRVSNFEAYHIKAQELANELRVKCSGSTNIGENIQNKSSEVTVQGPHEKIVQDLLVAKGLSPAWFNVTNKLKAKKKRT